MDQQLQKFKSLTGPEQVALVFNERFHGHSFLFWRRSAEVWRTSADAELYGEQETLVNSPDPDTNSALASEVKSADVEHARYAVFLLCLRARFVPQSEFLIKQVNGFSWSPYARPGRYSPFPPNLARLGREASQAIVEATKSSNPRLQTTAKLYSFSLLEELESVPTTELVKKWRAETVKSRNCSSYSALDPYEPVQLIFLLKRSLAARGLDAAIAISSLLKTEANAEARNQEIEMLRFLDAASVRLRGSAEGRDAILTIEKAWGQELRFCGQRLYKTKETRENSWKELEDQFLKDKFPDSCAVGSWATLIAVALDEQYGDHLSVAFENRYRRCGPQLERFLSRLTDIDPAFPAWEFPSTATQADMLHPRFAAKIRRYHEAWLKMSLSNDDVWDTRNAR